MADLRELYQQVILDHNKNPRNFRRIESPSKTAEGYNPLCGDHYTFFLALDGDVITDIGFQGSGCAISKASASVMTSMVKGKTKDEAAEYFKSFRDMVTGTKEKDLDKEGRLAAFAGVAEYPSRVKCATLAWHTVNSALRGEAAPVSTE